MDMIFPDALTDDEKLTMLKKIALDDVGGIDIANSFFAVADPRNKAMAGIVEYIGMRGGVITKQLSRADYLILAKDMKPNRSVAVAYDLLRENGKIKIIIAETMKESWRTRKTTANSSAEAKKTKGQAGSVPVPAVKTEEKTKPVKKTEPENKLPRAWKSLFTGTIRGRGLDYYRNGKVKQIQKKEDGAAGVVAGSSDYHISIQWKNGTIESMTCDCPYAKDGINCKHEAALLYALEMEGRAVRASGETKGEYLAPVKRTAAKPTAVELPIVAEVPSDLPEVWEPPVYYVEEINVTGDEKEEWEYTQRPDPSGTGRKIVHLLDYLGNKERIILPAYIDGQKVETLGTLEKCRAKHVEIPGCYGVIKKRVVWKNEHIETLVVGEGIREIPSNLVFDLGADNKVKNLYVSASLERVVGEEWTGGKGWFKLFPGSWVILGSTLVAYRGNATVLRVPRGVKTIGTAGVENTIREIQLPDSVTAVHDSAFIYQNQLSRFSYTPSLKQLGRNAFNTSSPWFQENNRNGMLIINNMLYQYTGMEERVSVPQGITKVCKNAFVRETDGLTKNCILKELMLPPGLEAIEPYAFYACRTLEQVQFSEGLKSIGDSAFKNCWSLTELHMPDSLEEIGVSAMESCVRVITLTFGRDLRKIGAYAFGGCKRLRQIHFCQGVKEIGESAFVGCEALEKVDIPPTVERIGAKAFCGCKSLREVTGLENVREIGEDAFRGCTSLETIVLPRRLGMEITNGCTSLRRVVFHPDTESIPVRAFEGCTALTEIVWPKKLRQICREAFKGCIALKQAELPDTLTDIGYAAFQQCAALEEVIMPDSVNVYEEAFTGTPYQKKAHGDFVVVAGKLMKYQGTDEEVVVPEAVRVIGSMSFAEAWHVKKLILGDQVQEIECFVFKSDDRKLGEVPKLEMLEIGQGVKKIDKHAFQNCSRLSKVRWGKGICSIGSYAFEKCPITTMNLSKLKIKTLEESVFAGITAEKIVLPATLEKIERGALKCAKYLRTLDLSKTQVKCIGQEAFAACNALTEVKWPASLECIREDAFGQVRLKRVELSAGVRRIEAASFSLAEELVLADSLIASNYAAEYVEGKYSSGDSEHAVEAVMTQSSSLRYVRWDKPDYTSMDGYFITVLDLQSGQTLYRVYFSRMERKAWREELRSAWKLGEQCDFAVYDQYFMKTWNQFTRIEMAFCRLQYPYALTERYRKLYTAWLEQCLYIKSSAERVAEVISVRDDISYLELLEQYRAITDDRLDVLKQVAARHKAKKCIAWLDAYVARKEGI